MRIFNTVDKSTILSSWRVSEDLFVIFRRKAEQQSIAGIIWRAFISPGELQQEQVVVSLNYSIGTNYSKVTVVFLWSTLGK